MRWEFLRHIPKKKLILAVGDCGLILFALGLIQASDLTSSGAPLPAHGHFLVVAATFLFFFYLANLYVPLSSPFQKNKVAARIIMAVAGAALACLMLSLVNPTMNPGRHRIALLSLYMIPVAYVWRWAFEHAFTRFLHPVRVLIVGAGWAGSTIGSALGSFREFRVVGFVDDDPAKRTNNIASMPVLGATSDIQALVERHHASLIVLAITHEKRDTLFRTLLDCKMSGIELCDMPTLYEELAGRVPVNHVRDSWFVYSSLRGVRRTVYAARLKRVLDIALSLVGLVVSIPIVMVTALAITLTSGSPLLYRQTRVGQNEMEFWLLKFRSMRNGAEDTAGVVWAKPKDGRVTRVGRSIGWR